MIIDTNEITTTNEPTTPATTGFPSTTLTIRRGDIASALHSLGYMSIGSKRDPELKSSTNFIFATNLKRVGNINSLDDIKMVSAEEFANDYTTVLKILRLDGDTIEVRKFDNDFKKPHDVKKPFETKKPSFRKFDKKYRDFGKSLKNDYKKADYKTNDYHKRGGYKKDTIVEAVGTEGVHNG